ncbi:MAG: Holliday junction branch migration protein RuvA [Micrococcales bacterium]|nr:Holliday junction branch migration protein RuvA [Micrococcales bacterium]MCL2666444.1 Holliday junction branch migration protein RuvA [Micrococcales bacterium]
MIASVHGEVLSVGLDAVVVEVGGVGLALQATPGTLAGLRVGSPARLATSLLVREDALTLFGFASTDEREVFETVQTVSGIGPRLALAMLAVHTPDGLRRAVADEDLAALQRVPGVGRKSAQRIVLELKDRIGPPSGSGTATSATPKADDRRGQVVEALTGLGWPERAAAAAVDQVLDGSGDPVGADEVAGVLRAALRTLGGARG